MSTAEPAPDPTNPSTSGLAPTTNGIGSPPPTASAATKFSILTKVIIILPQHTCTHLLPTHQLINFQNDTYFFFQFLRRKNQVHTTTAQQNEFMQVFLICIRKRYRISSSIVVFLLNKNFEAL